MAIYPFQKLLVTISCIKITSLSDIIVINIVIPEPFCQYNEILYSTKKRHKLLKIMSFSATRSLCKSDIIIFDNVIHLMILT